MQLFNLLPTLFFFNPAFSSPTPPTVNCDSLLSFEQTGQHSIFSIRAFCNRRRKHKVRFEKRAESSVFDLPAERFGQPSKLSTTPVPPLLSEKASEVLPLTTSESASAPYPLDGLKFPNLRFEHTHHCSSARMHRLGQMITRWQSSLYNSFQSRVHGLAVVVHGMAPKLVVAAFLIVSMVILLLLAFEQWLEARMRWSRAELTSRPGIRNSSSSSPPPSPSCRCRPHSPRSFISTKSTKSLEILVTVTEEAEEGEKVDEANTAVH